MNSITDKEKFILSLFDKLDKTDEDVQNELYTFFMNITGGKVYKYRAFDTKGFSIENLKNGTLYCSPPSAFNDPFECRLGMDIQSLMVVKSGIEIDYIEEIFKHYVLVFYGNAKITDYNIKEQNIIQRLLDNKTMNLLLEKSYNFESEKDAFKELTQNTDYIFELIKIIMMDSQILQAFNTSEEMLKSKLNDCLTRMSSDSINAYPDLNLMYGTSYDADEISTVALISNEFYPENNNKVIQMERTFYTFEKTLKEKITNSFFVGCLAENYKNRLMWSHYADSHKGFCIEYDYSNYKCKDIIPFPVCYSENLVMIPWKYVINQNKENMHKATKEMMRALFTKDAIWSYENEWRILIPQSEEQSLKMPPISYIYIGAMCEEKNKHELIKIAKELNVPIKQMTIDRGKYLLHASEIKLK